MSDKRASSATSSVAGSAPSRSPGGTLRRIVTAITGPWTVRNGLSWLALLLFVLVFRWLVYEPYVIPTGSMEPTLHGDPDDGDHVGANKLLYGPRIPFTSTRLFRIVKPKRWEIVVFRNPQKNSPNKRLVKRIVGLPGERIRIRTGRYGLTGKSKTLPRSREILHLHHHVGSRRKGRTPFRHRIDQLDWRSPPIDSPSPKRGVFRRTQTTLSTVEGCRQGFAHPEQADQYLSVFSSSSWRYVDQLYRAQQQYQYPLRYGILQDDAFSRVPEDCYLVCGDNSGDSVDGRFFGWLPEGNIMGRVFCIWWPMARWRDFTGSRTPGGEIPDLRSSRLVDPVGDQRPCSRSTAGQAIKRRVPRPNRVNEYSWRNWLAYG